MTQLDLFKIEINRPGSNQKLADLQDQTDPETYRRFSRLVAHALLHRSQDKYRIIDQALEQANERGISYVFCKVSSEAKRFMRLANDVGREKYRATAFMRLQPIDQHRVLYGEFETKHRTAELIMLHFMKRFPTYNIMLVLGEDVYIGRNNEIFREKIDRKKVELPQKKDEFERYWLAFYKSQYIAERRNLKYLKRMIPRQYWKWVTELKEFGLT
jgi:probable DNA metabolism protein